VMGPFISSLRMSGVKTFTWQDMVTEIEKSDVKIPGAGWMSVRDTLQWYIDAGVIARSDDVRIEEYILSN